jgi:hypothetical protein
MQRTRPYKNWAWAMFKGTGDMSYDMVISATDVVHFNVGRVRQLLDRKANAMGHMHAHDLNYCPRPRTCPSKRHACVPTKLGVPDAI